MSDTFHKTVSPDYRRQQKIQLSKKIRNKHAPSMFHGRNLIYSIQLFHTYTHICGEFCRRRRLQTSRNQTGYIHKGWWRQKTRKKNVKFPLNKNRLRLSELNKHCCLFLIILLIMVSIYFSVLWRRSLLALFVGGIGRKGVNGTTSDWGP